MANLEQIVSRKAENDTKWKEAQQAERENTTAMQDAGITEITSNPEAYARYLEMQGDNPSYSAGNIALVMFGNPEATVFGTRDRWKTLNRSVMDSEKNNGVKIFARSPMGRGYTLADAYDIKQTQGRDISRITLQNDSKEMEAALTTVLNYAVVRPHPRSGFLQHGQPAFYRGNITDFFSRVSSPRHLARPRWCRAIPALW